MNQSQQNLVKLAQLSRNDKKQLAACAATAKKIALPKKALTPKPQNAATKRLQNFVKGIHPQDLQNAVAKYGTTAVFNKVNTDSILQTAAAKFAELALKKAGRV